MTELSLRTRESFDAVMRKYADMVYRLAYSRTGSTFDADDILQEVFLRYIKADKTYNDEEHRKSWLIRITINCTRSFASSAWNRHREYEEPDENTGAEDPALSAAETRSDVMNALLALPEKYRTVICLFYYEDMSVSQIAKSVGITDSNVKARLSRGRDMLREKLKGVEFDV
ncbi:MAG: sigma-70 family RNA polymerase sigma factor [Ruminiclostridium sp.]|nr:sigma-70 family RNA polymerase sigma factor [Ruminiclostridium sp.]